MRNGVRVICNSFEMWTPKMELEVFGALRACRAERCASVSSAVLLEGRPTLVGTGREGVIQKDTGGSVNDTASCGSPIVFPTSFSTELR